MLTGVSSEPIFVNGYFGLWWFNDWQHFVGSFKTNTSLLQNNPYLRRALLKKSRMVFGSLHIVGTPHTEALACFLCRYLAYTSLPPHTSVGSVRAMLAGQGDDTCPPCKEGGAAGRERWGGRGWGEGGVGDEGGVGVGGGDVMIEMSQAAKAEEKSPVSSEKEPYVSWKRALCILKESPMSEKEPCVF